MTTFDLTVIGDLNLDILLEVPRFPVVDDEIEVVSRRQSTGGDAANICAAAARLGQAPILIARAGDDAGGRALAAGLEAVGVDIQYIQWDDEHPTGCVIGMVRPDGQRNLLTYRGANRNLHLGAQQRQAVLHSRFVHLSDPQPWIIDELLAIIPPGVHLSIDPGGITAARGIGSLKPLLERTQVFFSNQVELQQISGIATIDEAAYAIRSAGAQIVVIKRGEQGCRVMASSGSIDVPGLPVAVVDATGAGDAFDGAFLTALSEGAPLAEAARFANAVGALTTLQIGAQTAQPNRQQVTELLSRASHI